MALAAFTTPPNIATDFAGWLAWKDARRLAFLTYCPIERSTTYYFAQSGDDNTGDGSLGNPWKTRAKAIAIEAAGNGDMRLRFNCGDVWDEDDDWVITHDNVTVDSYGAGAKPLFNAFKTKYLDSANVWGSQSGNRWQVAETNDIAWLRKSDDRLGETLGTTLVRVGDATACAALDNSWFWGSNVLYVNLGGTDPNTVDLEAVISNDNNGVEFQGDGCRCQGLRADGFGMDRTTTATQAQPFTNRTLGADANLFIDCEGYFSGSHVIAHHGGASTGQGGVAMFIDCVAGYAKYNSASETIFNAFTDDGGHETWFLGCEVAYGCLRSSDWTYASLIGRGGGFYGHVGSGGLDSCDLFVMHGCSVRSGSIAPPKHLGVSGQSPTAATLDDVRCFVVNCTHPAPTSAMLQSNNFDSNAVYYGNAYRFKNVSSTPFAQVNTTIANCWILNCYIEMDQAAITGSFGFSNANPASDTIAIQFWHTWINVINQPAQNFGLDYDLRADNSTAAGAGHLAGSSLINSIVTYSSSAANARLALTNSASRVINNAFFNVDQPGANLESGYELATNTIQLAGIPTLGTRMEALIRAATSDASAIMPNLSHDMNGRRRTAAAPDIGPVDFSSAFPLVRPGVRRSVMRSVLRSPLTTAHS